MISLVCPMLKRYGMDSMYITPNMLQTIIHVYVFMSTGVRIKHTAFSEFQVSPIRSIIIWYVSV